VGDARTAVFDELGLECLTADYSRRELHGGLHALAHIAVWHAEASAFEAGEPTRVGLKERVALDGT